MALFVRQTCAELWVIDYGGFLEKLFDRSGGHPKRADTASKSVVDGGSIDGKSDGAAKKSDEVAQASDHSHFVSWDCRLSSDDLTGRARKGIYVVRGLHGDAEKVNSYV